MVVAAVYPARRGAEAARDFLESEGVEASVSAGSAGGDDASGTLAQPRQQGTGMGLLVPGGKLEEARRALGEAQLLPAGNAAPPAEDASLPVMGLIFVAIAVVTAAVFIVLFLSALF